MSIERNSTFPGASWSASWWAVLALVAAVSLSGCRSPEKMSQQEQIAAAAARAEVAATQREEQQRTNTDEQPKTGQQTKQRADPETFILREGDVVRITFAGAPSLNSVAAIRRDGKITMPLIGEVDAAGYSPTGLANKLIELYGPQLQTKEITVGLASSPFVVYVTGAVGRPGKIVAERQLTVFEAIVEAGGFNSGRANLKKVRVIRYDKNGKASYFTLNVRKVLTGKDDTPFLLEPLDILYVPERFTWF